MLFYWLLNIETFTLVDIINYLGAPDFVLFQMGETQRSYIHEKKLSRYFNSASSMYDLSERERESGQKHAILRMCSFLFTCSFSFSSWSRIQASFDMWQLWTTDDLPSEITKLDVPQRRIYHAGP